MFRHLISCSTALVLIAVASRVHADDLSGTYVGQYSNAAILLQVVETPNKAIDGRLEEVVLTPNQSGITISNQTVSGAIGGRTIVLMINDAIPASGTLNDHVLQISGGSGGSFFAYTLRKASQAVYNQHAEALESIAQENQQRMAKAATIEKEEAMNAAELSQIARTAQMLETDSDQADQVIARLGRCDAKFQEIEGKMRDTLDQESRIAGLDRGPKRAGLADRIYGFGDAIQGVADRIVGQKNAIYYTDHDTNIHQDVRMAAAYCSVHTALAVCVQYAVADRGYQQHVMDLSQAFNNASREEASAFAKRKAIEKKSVALENE
ncbi:MAG: hypothetical protein KGL09_09660 [Pseudomonadota bacterium]|jgi:hypothetical protein|nr:hypothetical protein [Pseudomonadota bacterium]MDE3142070.1 hypothetical protein [Pseudomonadota bacterium]